MASAPGLLNPIRLMSARCLPSRNMRGLGFPSCGCNVMPPISDQPKPRCPHWSKHSAFLSIPAARPTGLSKERLNTRLGTLGERYSKREMPTPAEILSAAKEREWAFSESCTATRGRANNRYPSPIQTIGPGRHPSSVPSLRRVDGREIRGSCRGCAPAVAQ